MVMLSGERVPSSLFLEMGQSRFQWMLIMFITFPISASLGFWANPFGIIYFNKYVQSLFYEGVQRNPLFRAQGLGKLALQLKRINNKGLSYNSSKNQPCHAHPKSTCEICSAYKKAPVESRGRMLLKSQSMDWFKGNFTGKPHI